VARILKMPPHMLGDLSRATFSNIADQNMQFLQMTLAPWLVLWEQRVRMHLFPEREVESHFVEHKREMFLAMDIKSQNEANAIEMNNGSLSINEVRKMRNRSPLRPEIGDVYRVPGNMIAAENLWKMGASEKAPVEKKGLGEEKTTEDTENTENRNDE